MISLLNLKLALSSLLFLSFTVGAQEVKTQAEKELELVNFQKLKTVLSQDGLSEAAKNKKRQVELIKEEKKIIEQSKYLYPPLEVLRGISSEYFLVKNAQVLNWDFDKPDYGIDSTFKNLLEKLGFIQRRVKIIVFNSSQFIRFAVPGKDNDVILGLSLPFSKSLDLNKMEMSLLLLEDFLRYDMGQVFKQLNEEELRKIASTQFEEKNFQLQPVLNYADAERVLFSEKGFNFQQQFELTKKMDILLKPHAEIWNVYFQLLGRLDRMIKVNNLYKSYPKIYPSPEMQIKWLSPEERVL